MDEDRARITRIFDESMNQRNLAVIDELFHEDFVEHGPFGDIVGRDAFKAFLQSWLDAFSDLRATVDHIIIDGDWAAWQVHFTGTHDGALMGIPATGRQVRVTGVNMARRDGDGLAVEHWSGNDVLQMLGQLGLMPPLGESAAASA